ncbi:unnamed protein product, partial [Darwinula stevensoni]
KKHPELRQAELLAAASKSFLREVLGSPEDYLSDNGATLVFNTVLEKCLDVEGSQEAFQLLAEKIKEPLVPGEVKHIVERSATHLMLKKLIMEETSVSDRDNGDHSHCLKQLREGLAPANPLAGGFHRDWRDP